MQRKSCGSNFSSVDREVYEENFEKLKRNVLSIEMLTIYLPQKKNNRIIGMVLNYFGFWRGKVRERCLWASYSKEKKYWNSQSREIKLTPWWNTECDLFLFFMCVATFGMVVVAANECMHEGTHTQLNNQMNCLLFFLAQWEEQHKAIWFK